MGTSRQYILLIGLFILAGVAGLLLSPLDMILGHHATFIGTDLRLASGDETPVRTKMDLGGSEYMESFPEYLPNWIGSQHDSSEMAERLGADFLMFRTYLSIGPLDSAPIHLAIIQSKDRSTFHPPPVCYRAVGWEIQEEGTVGIPVSDTSWASHQEVDPQGNLVSTITAKTMVVTKEAAGGEEERELVLYFYVKGRMFEDTITVVEIAAETPERFYNDQLLASSHFMGEAIPYMFEPAEEEGMLAAELAQSWGGISLIVVGLAIPLGLVAYSVVRRRSSSRGRVK